MHERKPDNRPSTAEGHRKGRMGTYVIDEASVPARRNEGDTADVRVVFDSSNGCDRLTQRVVRFAHGESRPRSLDGSQEVAYVVAGHATLVVGDEEHELGPDMGVYLVSGETYSVRNDGAEQLTVVSVETPQNGDPAPDRRTTVRLAEREELAADENRTFRYLVHEDVGCSDVTQFMGIVKPCRAPDHSHPYDEVGFIVEGSGLAHVGGASTPIGPGSCFHLPPQKVHCIENRGPGVMRIMGVFYPSGSPRQRSYDGAGGN